jgi:hypothetical protein
MNELRDAIAHCNSGEPRPSVEALVINDGFDELEKGDAKAFYSRKSWRDVLRHLRGLKDQPVFRAAYHLEEWSVLRKTALSYYIRAHLEFLLDQLGDEDPDELFVHSFIGELYQVAHMYRGSPFSQEQTALLRQVAETVSRDAMDLKRYGELGIDIDRGVGQFLEALD